MQIKSVPQLEAALAYLSSIGPDALDESAFAEKSGVGEFLSHQ